MTCTTPSMLNRARTRTGYAVEFPIVLIVLLLVIAFPLIDLIGVGIGAGTVYFGARQSAAAASTQQTYTNALSAMQAQAVGLTNSGFGSFVKLVPAGGYQNCGVDLFVVATDYTLNTSSTYGPNQPVPPPVDTTRDVYECSAHALFDVGPIVNMRGIPFVGNVPGLGAPVRITMTVDRASEFPAGLEVGPNQTTQNDTQPAQLNNNPSSTVNSVAVESSGWNYPNIYQLIQAAGQTVVAQNVLTVYANAATWTDSGVSVAPGDKVWLDTQASGVWNPDPAMTPQSNANGATTYGTGSNNAPLMCSDGFPLGALIAKVGGGNSNGSGGSADFMLGVSQLNLVPPVGSGELWLISDNIGVVPQPSRAGVGIARAASQATGQMMVRVIVTR